MRGTAGRLPLADASVELAVTSPPYWGLRDYRDGGESLRGQLGAEPDPHAYVDALLAVTVECMRVLRPGGSLFVNIGDKRSDRAGGVDRGTMGTLNGRGRKARPPRANTTSVAPRGSRLLLPERYALACLDRLGLSVRQTIVWDKPSGMPESVRDRCRDSHEVIYHLVRPDERYYAAVDRIRTPHLMRPQRRPNGRPVDDTPRQGGQPKQGWPTAVRYDRGVDGHPLGALPGSVWRIPTVPLDVPEWLGEDHHAAFPPELARRIVLGWSPERVCLDCGQGLAPVVERSHVEDRPGRKQGREGDTLRHAPDGRDGDRRATVAVIVGESCACPHGPVRTRPAVVLDPFGGSGTTALVADVHGRTGLSVDLSHGYSRIACWRTTDPRERARAAAVPAPPVRTPDPSTGWAQEELL